MRIERAIDVGSSQIGSAPAEDDLAHLFLVSDDLGCIVGPDGCFRFVNPAWEPCLGWTAEDLLARPFLDFVHPDDRGATTAEVRRIAGGGGVTGFEIPVSQQGRRRPEASMERDLLAGSGRRFAPRPATSPARSGLNAS